MSCILTEVISPGLEVRKTIQGNGNNRELVCLETKKEMLGSLQIAAEVWCLGWENTPADSKRS